MNDNKYYFSDGITSCPCEHPSLQPLREKNKKFKEIQKHIQENKSDFLNHESRVIEKCQRIYP